MKKKRLKSMALIVLTLLIAWQVNGCASDQRKVSIITGLYNHGI